MEPQNQPQLDQQVVNLAKAIRSVETKGQKDPFTAKGASGEYGAYQFTDDSWKKWSKQYLGRDVPLEKSTNLEQNEVAYKHLKSLKDQGYNVGQIASVWNSGKPDAYADPNYKGVNKYGVKYDVPQYAKSVAEAYQSIKGTGEPTITPTTASTVGHEQMAEPEQKKGFLEKAEGIVSKIFPGQKVGQAIGTLGGYLMASPEEKEFYDTSAPTPLQVAGDVAQGALMVGTGLPEAGASTALGKTALGGAKSILPAAQTAAGRIAQGVGVGSGFGLSGGLARGETDTKELAKETAISGAAGGLVSGAGEVIRKAIEWLPGRFARGLIGSPANDESVKVAVDRGLKAPEKMLAEAKQNKQIVGKQLGDALKSPQYKNVKVDGKTMLNAVAEQFPDSGLTYKDIALQLRKSAPLKETLIQKLVRGKITLAELHSLNSDIGSNVFKTAFDDPAVKAGKDVGNAAYHVFGDFIKQTAPETVPLFDAYSKEVPLVKALELMIKRSNKARPFTLRDIVALLAGSGVAGVPGAMFALGAEKALVNPSVNFGVMGALQKLGGPTTQQLQQGLKPALLRGVSQGIGSLNQ